MRKGAGRGQGCSAGRRLSLALWWAGAAGEAAKALAVGAFASGTTLILAGAAPEGLAGF